MDYIEMYEAAADILKTVDDCPTGLPLAQVTVLLGESGGLYFAVNDLVGAVCRKLTETGETGVAAMMTVWQDGALDLSSYTFRRSLCAWNEACGDTAVVLGEAPEFHTRALRDTMP